MDTILIVAIFCWSHDQSLSDQTLTVNLQRNEINLSGEKHQLLRAEGSVIQTPAIDIYFHAGLVDLTYNDEGKFCIGHLKIKDNEANDKNQAQHIQKYD